MLKLWKKTGDYDVIFRSALLTYDSESSLKNMYLTAVFLLKYLGSYRLQLVALVRVLNIVKSSLSRTPPSTVNSSAATGEGDSDQSGLLGATPRTWSLFRGRQVDQRLFLLHQVLKQRLEEGLQLRLDPFVLVDKNVFNVFCSYLGEFNDPNAL
jgi:hypothetical protein